MMHTICLQSQEPFGSSFPPNFPTASVNEEMGSFFNVVLRGQSALHGQIGGDSNLDEVNRIDAVWDNYPAENNLKSLTQQ